MKRVFVTGVQGFTARCLVPRLQADGFEVHGLFRPNVPDPVDLDGVCRHDADLTDLRALTEIVERVDPTLVVHLAGIAFVAHSNAREIYDSNLIGTRNLLQALVDGGATPTSVLLPSSANVYGNRHGILSEDVRPQPVNEYGISKLAMEFMAQLFMDRLPIVLVRPFNYTGVGQSTHFVIPKIVDRARARAPSVELGNIDVQRDFSDVRGVADCYVRLLNEEEAIGGTFNVCSGRAYSLRDVIGLVQRISGHELKVETNPAFVRENEVESLYGDNRRLIDAIGPLSMPPLEETLRWMIEA